MHYIHTYVLHTYSYYIVLLLSSAPFLSSMEAALEEACMEAKFRLEGNEALLQAVEAATAVLEDEPLTNAGIGSNLSMSGHVECDASVMSGDGSFGAVAAVSAVKNPISVATRLAIESRTPMRHGLVRPIMLASEGARQWAATKGLETYNAEEEADAHMITQAAKRRHQMYLQIIEKDGLEYPDYNAPPREKRKFESELAGEDVRYDTVGCVVVNFQGDVAAGVSSGGIALKSPGRVGEAAIYGAGCWAKNNCNCLSGCSVATSVTGVGENIIKHMIGQKVAQAVEHSCGDGITEVSSQLLSSTMNDCRVPRECGVLCARSCVQNGSLQVEIGATCYAAQSMAVGWLGQDEAGKVIRGFKIIRRGEEPNDLICLSIGTRWKYQSS